MEGCASIVWILLLICFGLIPKTITFNGVPIKGVFTRVFLGLVFMLISSFIFYILGFVGKFLLTPFFKF